MKKIISAAFCLFLAVQAWGQTYTLQEYEEFALQNSKSLKVSQERITAAENLRKAAFTQFLPSFQAVGTYAWNQKNISLLSQDALLPVGSKMADGTFGFTADQISNKWTIIDGQPVPLDAEGVPFNPKTNPEKIQWKQYAYLPKSEMTFDVHNIFAAGIGFTQPIYLGGKIRELYNIAKTTEDMARLQTDNNQEELILSVDQSYWQTVSLINKKKLAEKYKLRVIPVGDAVQLFRKYTPVQYEPSAETVEYPKRPSSKGDVVGSARWNVDGDEKKLTVDYIHMNLNGRYLQACVWFSFLYGVPADKITWVPKKGVSKETAELLRKCAKDALDEYPQVK